VRTEALSAPDAAPAKTASAESPATSAAFAVGGVVAGKYVIERVIGEGGLGTVVAARHLQLEQRVAIKYLLPATLKSPSLVERFVREGRLAASIKSEHVVRIYDVGTLPTGEPYMVMEYLAGSDLRSLVKGGPLPAGDAVDYLLQACEALAEAHLAGIVHRDLKPENFFLAFGPAGTTSIKLLDFGISKLNDTDVSKGLPLTTDTERFGTPSYMSPEQLRAAGKVDIRADIWSLGVVLFELLTGRRPFEGTTFPQICTSIVTAPPLALRELLPDAPAALEAVILRCLEKDAQSRFQDVGELAQMLALFGLEESARRGKHIRRVLAGPTSTRSAPPSSPRLPTPGGYHHTPKQLRVSTPGALGRVIPSRRRETGSSSGAAEPVSLPRIRVASSASGAHEAVAVSSAGAPEPVSSAGAPEPVSSAEAPGRVSSVGTLGVVARDATTTATEILPRRRIRWQSAMPLALTALISMSAAVTVMTLRADRVQPTPGPAGSLAGSLAATAAVAAAPPAATSAPLPPLPAAPAASPAIPSGSHEAPAPPPSASAATPTSPRSVKVPARADPSAAPTKHPAPAASFDPGGVVNPFQ
jgi:serine/threonine protein kinase